jgi:hypothetical protein
VYRLREHMRTHKDLEWFVPPKLVCVCVLPEEGLSHSRVRQA